MATYTNTGRVIFIYRFARETERAYAVEFSWAGAKGGGESRVVWLPKSQVAVEPAAANMLQVTIPAWIVRNENLDRTDYHGQPVWEPIMGEPERTAA